MVSAVDVKHSPYGLCRGRKAIVLMVSVVVLIVSAVDVKHSPYGLCRGPYRLCRGRKA